MTDSTVVIGSLPHSLIFPRLASATFTGIRKVHPIGSRTTTTVVIGPHVHLFSRAWHQVRVPVFV